jgi:hypothetical protein
LSSSHGGTRRLMQSRLLTDNTSIGGLACVCVGGGGLLGLSSSQHSSRNWILTQSRLCISCNGFTPASKV